MQLFVNESDEFVLSWAEIREVNVKKITKKVNRQIDFVIMNFRFSLLSIYRF